VKPIVNTLQEDITIDSPHGELQETENDNDATIVIFTTAVVENSNRLFKLRELRVDHLNSEERVSLVKICEEYNDVFCLPVTN
jgi:hypothetical protein